MDPSLAALRSFVAVVDAGSMVRAAELLHVTTPALSQQITRLERQLGTDLFDRTPAGAVATPEGVHLAELARRALDAYGDVLGWRDAAVSSPARRGAAVVAHVGTAARRVGAVGAASIGDGFAPRTISWLASDLDAALAGLDDGTIAALLVRDADLREPARTRALSRASGRPSREAHPVGEPDAVVAVVGEQSALVGSGEATAAELRALVFAANATPGADLLSLHELAPAACPEPERRRPVASLVEAVALAATAPIAVLTYASSAAAAFTPGTRVVAVRDLDPVATLLVTISDPVLRPHRKHANL